MSTYVVPQELLDLVWLVDVYIVHSCIFRLTLNGVYSRKKN